MDKVTPEYVRALIETNSLAVERALLVLLSRQTEGEQQAEATLGNNKMGFTGCDAKILTSFAKQIKASTYPAGRRLSPKQLALARRKLLKYAKQLATYANNKYAVQVEGALGVQTDNTLFVNGGTFTPVEG